MKKSPSIIHLTVLSLSLLVIGCQESSAPTPTETASPQGTTSATSPPPPLSAMPSPPPNPPMQEDRTLAFINLSAANFSMEAIQENKKLVEENPEDANALTQLGHANYMIQRFPTARDYYEQAVRANGRLVEARLGLSNCYALLDQVDGALRELEAVLAFEPDQPIALYNQGLLLLYAKGDHARARQAWERLVSHDPNHDLSRRATEQLTRL